MNTQTESEWLGASSVLPGAASSGAPKAGSTLPFDPLRLVAALLRRWFVLISTGVAMAVLAGLVGYLRFTAQYKAAGQLMRQESSSTFRASELGEPFKPRQLSVLTLVSFMKSPAVLQRVGEATRLSARSVAAGLIIAPERNTDLISLSFTTSQSAAMAVRVLNAFGNEVVRLTREMQTQEAAEMNSVLKRQLTRTEEDLRTVNRELLEFSQQAGLINADKEIDAYLRSLGDLDLRFETTRIDFETLDLKIGALERELAANNPLAERVQVAREKLNELLQHYTEANPIVEEQKSALADLEGRLAKVGNGAVAPPRQGESSLAAGFYADLLNLKTQKQVAAAQIEKLKAVRAGVEAKLRGLPEKGMQLARIRARQQSLEASQSLLASRQREAQLYAESALGYYRFFEAKPEEVEVAGRSQIMLLLAAAAGLLGFGVAITLVGLVESLDDHIKTASDLKRVTRLPLLATLPELDTLDVVAQANWAFRTWLALQAKFVIGPQRQVVCGFVSTSGHAGCSTWVELLAHAASQRDDAVVVVTHRPPVNGLHRPLAEALAQPSLVPILPGQIQWLIAPSDWRWNAHHRSQWQAALETWNRQERLVLLIELPPADQPETLSMAETLPQLIWLVGSGTTLGRPTAERIQTFQHAGCRLVGAVLNREPKLFPWL